MGKAAAPSPPAHHGGGTYLGGGMTVGVAGDEGRRRLGLHLGQRLLMDHQQLAALAAHQNHPYRGPRRPHTML